MMVSRCTICVLCKLFCCVLLQNQNLQFTRQSVSSKSTPLWKCWVGKRHSSSSTTINNVPLSLSHCVPASPSSAAHQDNHNELPGMVMSWITHTRWQISLDNWRSKTHHSGSTYTLSFVRIHLHLHTLQKHISVSGVPLSVASRSLVER